MKRAILAAGIAAPTLLGCNSGTEAGVVVYDSVAITVSHSSEFRSDEWPVIVVERSDHEEYTTATHIQVAQVEFPITVENSGPWDPTQTIIAGAISEERAKWAADNPADCVSPDSEGAFPEAVELVVGSKTVGECLQERRERAP